MKKKPLRVVRLKSVRATPVLKPENAFATAIRKKLKEIKQENARPGADHTDLSLFRSK